MPALPLRTAAHCARLDAISAYSSGCATSHTCSRVKRALVSVREGLRGRLHAVEETSNAMALDGIMFEGVSVRVRRPNDYNPAAAAALGPAVPNPALNLSAIGLHPGGMNAVSSRPLPRSNATVLHM